MPVTIDATELVTFSLDLVGLADSAVPRVRPVVFKGAQNIKSAMRADMLSSAHFRGKRGRGTASSIDFDIRSGAQGVEAEIGPDKARGGGLANIAYFGGSHGGGGTVRDPLLALIDEAPSFIRYLADLLEEV